MSPSEKGYFKKFAARHTIGDKNNYLRLFDLIDKQTTYNEDQISKKIKQRGQFAYFKNYLFELLLKGLSSYHTEMSVDITINNLLTQIEILQNKGLYDLCVKLISRAKGIAIENEKFNDAIKILKIEDLIAIKAG
jgi:hypothetical protein